MTLDGRYELQKELGRGSTGTVWEARDHLTSDVVAVKVVHPDLLGSPSARRRFLREVASAGALRHPHTVRVLAHGQTPEGSGYLVMERLVGVTLSSRLAESGPLEQRRAIKIAAQILDAAGAAHRSQIVHRDLKPSNVMLVEQDGDPEFVKVCDFGLAKAIEVEDPPAGEVSDGGAVRGSTTTEVGEICGTPTYMAPEQARGEEVDARADLYAVGVLLFEALVGKVPFSGRSTLAVVSQHLSAAPPRPSTLRPELRIFPPLESLILRALAKNRAERPSSAEVFRADLLQIERDLVREAQRTRRETPPRSSSGDAATLPRRGEEVSTGRAVAPLRRAVARVAIAGAIVVGAAVGLRAGWRRAFPADAGPAQHTTTVRSGGGRAVASPPAPPPEEGSPGPVSTTSAPPPDARVPAAVVQRPPGPAGGAEPRAARPRARSGVTKSGEAAGRTARSTEAASAPVDAPAAREDAAGDRAEADRLVARAEALLGQGRIADACALGRAASDVAPSSARAWELLGRCHMRLGQPAEARAAYRRYLALAPDGPDALFVRAIVDREQP